MAARQLGDQVAERGDLAELRVRADASDGRAEPSLAKLLAERGDRDELRARVNVGYLHDT
jgi:hypothetical protein